ncbi:MAG: hypothetical protein AAF762_01905 [Pseudomonadota bacterium]
MGRIIAIAAVALAGYLWVNDGRITLPGNGGSGSGFNSYTGSSAPAIKGIVGAAGG